MDKDVLWRKFQKHMGYTDDEMAVFRADPLKVKMVTESPAFVKSRIVAEVVEVHNCHAGHTVGQKIVMNGNGQIQTRECPEKMCLFAVAALEGAVNGIYERFIDHADLGYERSVTVQCSDVGIDKGGWGKILMKVYAEPLTRTRV